MYFLWKIILKQINKHSWLSKFISKLIKKISKIIKIKRKSKIPKRENKKKTRISNPTNPHLMSWSMGLKIGKNVQKRSKSNKTKPQNHYAIN